MSFSSERADIEGRFKTLWVVGTAPRTPVGFDMHAFAPVAGSVRLTIINGGSDTVSVGSPGGNLVRYAGIISIEVYTEGGVGTAASRTIEDAAAAVFRNAIFGGIRCGAPYLSGARQEPPFLVRTLMIPFTRDEFHG